MAELILLLHNEDTNAGTTTEWCRERKIDFEVRVASKPDPLPTEFHGLIVFGGDMEVWEEAANPWLKREKQFLHSCLHEDRRVFGLCLGAQLLAEQLGAEVKPLDAWEVGWYPVEVEGRTENLVPLHWHSSGFAPPPHCERIARNSHWVNQGFRRSPRQLGYQFHAEIDSVRLEHALKGWKDNMVGVVQTPAQIRTNANERMTDLQAWYFAELDAWWRS